jgi:succinate dehydrogenase/fumarate reductase flavoprotein subunit
MTQYDYTLYAAFMNPKNMTEEKENTESNEPEISRRNFMKGTAAGAALIAGGTLLGAAPSAASAQSKLGTALPASVAGKNQATNRDASSSVPTSWSQTADVVVIGYGGAGAAAAITAYDSGASVLVLEKSPSLASLGVTGTTPAYSISGGGGNTHIAGGYCLSPTASEVNAAATAHYKLSWGETPLEVCEAWATVASGNKDFFDKMGIPYTNPTVNEFPPIQGTGVHTLVTTGGGQVLFQKLDQAVQKRGIPILFNSPATDLIQNPTTKEIVGVRALSNFSEVLNVRANRAVVLCAGGFEFDEEMKANYLKEYPTHFGGWSYNTGDGIRMAQKVGAGLWHMTAVSCNLCAWVPDYPSAWLTTLPGNNLIYVDKYGKRWCNERDSGSYYHCFGYTLADFNLHVPEYTRNPTFAIFDETTRKLGSFAAGQTMMGMMNAPPQVGGIPTWSSDNSAEIAKGWILKGATSVTDLANAINSWGAKIVSSTWSSAIPITVNMDPSVLNATVNAWNQAVAAGVDTQFGRAASTLAAISTPPFYALPLWAGSVNTLGGPIRNQKGQVCDPDHNLIPRLYSAGECGAALGFLYEGGGGAITDAITWGRISGNNAAAETPWT